MEQSRRGFLGFLLGSGAGVVAGVLPASAVDESPHEPRAKPNAPTVASQVLSNPHVQPGDVARTALRFQVGNDVFDAWFHTMQFERFDGDTVTVSLPVRFVCTWIRDHYYDELLDAHRVEFLSARRVEIVLRQPGGGHVRVA